MKIVIVNYYSDSNKGIEQITRLEKIIKSVNTCF